MDFGQALDIVKNGGMIYRDGWNGKNLFVFRQVPAEIDVAGIVPKMQSLPGLVKNEFARRLESGHASIFYSDQLALVNGGNGISGWSPSTSDALAEDWRVYRRQEGDVA